MHSLCLWIQDGNFFSGKDGDAHAMARKKDGSPKNQRCGNSDAFVCGILLLIMAVVLLDLVTDYSERQTEAFRPSSAMQDAGSQDSIPWRPHPKR